MSRKCKGFRLTCQEEAGCLRQYLRNVQTRCDMVSFRRYKLETIMWRFCMHRCVIDSARKLDYVDLVA